MKKSLLLVLMVTLLFVFGCREKDENKVDSERVAVFDKMIVDLQGEVKKDITVSVVNGIYIKTANRIEVYHLSDISGLSFEEKVVLILNMDKYSTATYIVLNNNYITWKNYKDINDFAEAPSVLNIIGLKTVVYDMIGKKEVYGDGAEVGYIPVTGYVDNSKYYNYTRSTFPIGGGVQGPHDYAKSNIFVDLIKTASSAGLPNEPWSGEAKCDEDGWPLEDFGVILMRDLYNIENKGTYKISFECSVIPTIQNISFNGTISNLVRNEETGVVTCDLILTENQPHMMLSFTNTNGGLKNLKVLRPGYNERQTFTKEFLDHMSRFSAIRTMDFTFTNNNMQETWADRRKPTDGFPDKNRWVIGASWEHCVELANTLKSDLWINIPHKVDKDYVRKVAELIKNQLDPDLNLYFEYSNENWNWMFTQTFWFLDESKKEPYYSKLSYDGQNNEYYIHWRMVGEKLKECVDIFAEVWGADAINKRVRPVLAAQIGQEPTYGEPLLYLRDTYGDPSKYIYAVAGAPYFGLGESATATGLTLDNAITALYENVETFRIHYEVMRETAQEHGVKMLAYEGGIDTFGPENISIKEAIQSDPRLKAVVIKYLEDWYYAGGELFCWYVAGAGAWNTQYGTWGLINNPYKDIGPKVEGIDAVIAGGFEKYASGQIPTDNPSMDITAQPILIDFNNYSDIGLNQNIENIVEKGIKFSGRYTTLQNQLLNYNTTVLHTYSWGETVTISREDKKPFSLKSVKLMRPYNTDQIQSAKIKVYFHTRSSDETIVNIPYAAGNNGLTYEFPEKWQKVGMKEVKIEFMELSNGEGSIRFGAIDDVLLYDVVK
jgi:hypothetical protein